MTNLKITTDKIATLEKALKSADTDTKKKLFKDKIAKLREILKTGNTDISAKELADSLLKSRKKFIEMASEDFDAVVKRLSEKSEYAFLKGYVRDEIIADIKRKAKPVGWRFKGKNNYKIPTKEQVTKGRKNKTVYYENRPERSDVSQIRQLAQGGSTYAKGGMVEHGLKIGDIIISKGINTIVVENSATISSSKKYVVNLQNGTREDYDLYAAGGVIKRVENNDEHGADAFLTGYEPYFEKDVNIARIDDKSKTVKPTHGYYPNHPLSKKAKAWAKKNGYTYSFEQGGSMAEGGEVYSIVKKGTDTHYDTNDERFYGGSWVREGDSKKYLESLMSNNPKKFEDCEIVNNNSFAKGGSTASENMGHYFQSEGTIFVDSNFVNFSKGKIPNSELKHYGYGDFYLDTPNGEIGFYRVGKDIDGFVGRTHKLVASDELVTELFDAMEGRYRELFAKGGSMARGGEVEDSSEYEVGDIVKVSSYNDNGNYDDFRERPLRITDKAISTNEHQGFDDTMLGYGLYDFVDDETNEEIHSSLYDYELEFFAKGGSMARGGEVEEWSVITDNEDEHFDNLEDAKEFWKDLSEKERKSGQFFRKSYYENEDGELEEDEVDIIEQFAKGGSMASSKNVPFLSQQDYDDTMGSFSLRLGEAEGKWKTDDGKSYKKIIQDRDDFYDNSEEYFYKQLQKAELNWKNDNGESYNNIMKMQKNFPRYAKGGSMGWGGYVDIIKVTEPRSGKRKETQIIRVETYREALERAEKLNNKNKNPDVSYITGNIYSKGGSIDFNKHLREGWTNKALIVEMLPTFDMVMRGESWMKPFKTKEDVAKFVNDNQPNFKRVNKDVITWFWNRVQQYNPTYAKGGSMARGGEIKGNFKAEIIVPYNYEYVVKEEFEFIEFVSKFLTKKWFGNGVWSVEVIKPLFESEYNQKIIIEIKIPEGSTQCGGIDDFKLTEFISKTLTKKWFGNGVWGVKIISTYAKGGSMAEGGDIDATIKNWYRKNYPTDDLGEELNDFNTFEDLYNGISNRVDVYEIIGVGDSVIRERLFDHLSNIKGVKYENIYQKWIDSMYADGGEVQDWMEEGLAYLIEETGFTDLEITIVSDNGNEFIANDNNVEYRVFKTEDDAQVEAEERVLDDLKENPEYFNRNWLMNYIDGRGFETVLFEINYQYVLDIKLDTGGNYENDLIEQLVLNGLMDEDDARSSEAEELAEERIEDLANLLTENQLDEGNDGLDYIIDNFGEEEAFRMIVENNSIDMDSATKNAVYVDGIAHFLSSYDGETLYLPNEYVAYRVN